MNFFGGYDEIQPYMLDDNDLGMRAWINNLKCIVYNKSYLIHLGEPNMKDDNYYWKYKYYFSGFSTSMFKNYKLKRLVLNYPPFVFFAIVKTLKQFLRRRNFNVIKSFFWSIGFFIRNLPKILKKRKEIQLKEK